MARNPEFTLPEDYIDDFSAPFVHSPEPFVSQDFEERHKSNRRQEKSTRVGYSHNQDIDSQESRFAFMIVNPHKARKYDRYGNHNVPASRIGEESFDAERFKRRLDEYTSQQLPENQDSRFRRVGSTSSDIPLNLGELHRIYGGDD